MKYAIYGAGSLGIVAAAFLKNKKEDVTIIDRNIKSVEAITKNGVKVVGKIDLEEKVKIVLDSKVEEKYDIIFLFTKQIKNEETIKKASQMLSTNGVICTMQNGLPEEDVIKVLGNNRTYGAAVGFGATRLGYGISELTSEVSSMSFSVGNLEGYSDIYLTEIVRILSLIGNVVVERNFIGARFSKLLINSAFSGMSTVCGATFGEVAKNKKSRIIVQGIIKECIDVAKKANIKIEPVQGKDIVKLLDYNNNLKKWFAFKIIPLAIKKHANLKASMLQDIEKGIPTEINSINNIIVEYGKRYNVATPLNKKVVEIICKLEKKELTPSFDNINLF